VRDVDRADRVDRDGGARRRLRCLDRYPARLRLTARDETERDNDE
jgi:hypothetical protein